MVFGLGIDQMRGNVDRKKPRKTYGQFRLLGVPSRQGFIGLGFRERMSWKGQLVFAISLEDSEEGNNVREQGSKGSSSLPDSQSG